MSAVGAVCGTNHSVYMACASLEGFSRCYQWDSHHCPRGGHRRTTGLQFLLHYLQIHSYNGPPHRMMAGTLCHQHKGIYCMWNTRPKLTCLQHLSTHARDGRVNCHKWWTIRFIYKYISFDAWQNAWHMTLHAIYSCNQHHMLYSYSNTYMQLHKYVAHHFCQCTCVVWLIMWDTHKATYVIIYNYVYNLHCVYITYSNVQRFMRWCSGV